MIEVYEAIVWTNSGRPFNYSCAYKDGWNRYRDILMCFNSDGLNLRVSEAGNQIKDGEEYILNRKKFYVWPLPSNRVKNIPGTLRKRIEGIRGIRCSIRRLSEEKDKELIDKLKNFIK